MEELIESYFDEAEINIHKEYDDDGDPIFYTEFKLEDGQFPLYLINARKPQTVSVHLQSPVTIPEGKRTPVAEYITRANIHGCEGSLKLDFNTGDLTYQYVMRYNPESDMQHIKFQLDVCLKVGIEEMETHFSGILSLVYNDIDPAQALSKAEFGSNHKLN